VGLDPFVENTAHLQRTLLQRARAGKIANGDLGVDWVPFFDQKGIPE